MGLLGIGQKLPVVQEQVLITLLHSTTVANQMYGTIFMPNLVLTYRTKFQPEYSQMLSTVSTMVLNLDLPVSLITGSNFLALRSSYRVFHGYRMPQRMKYKSETGNVQKVLKLSVRNAILFNFQHYLICLQNIICWRNKNTNCTKFEKLTYTHIIS